MGLELTTPGLWVQRSTNWATGEIYNTMENRIVTTQGIRANLVYIVSLVSS